MKRSLHSCGVIAGKPKATLHTSWCIVNKKLIALIKGIKTWGAQGSMAPTLLVVKQGIRNQPKPASYLAT